MQINDHNANDIITQNITNIFLDETIKRKIVYCMYLIVGKIWTATVKHIVYRDNAAYTKVCSGIIQIHC